MTQAAEHFDDLAALLAGYEQGNLSPAELAALNDRLVHDVEARRWFNEYFQLTAAIRSRYQVDATGSIPFESAVDAAPTVAPRGMTWLKYAAAAAVILLAAVGWLIQRPVSSSESSSPTGRIAIATLLHSRNVTWGSDPLTEGMPIADRTIAIREGRADLMIGAGTMMSLIGDTEVRLDGPMHVTMIRGRAVFDCPPSMKGFSVGLPGVEVMDLGTRFAVAQSEVDGTEVHVLKGHVRVSLTGGAMNGRQIELAANQAVHLTADRSTATDIALNVHAFDSERGDEVLISDTRGDRVLRYDLNGQYIGRFITSESNPPMRRPGGIVMGPDGRVYLAESDAGGRILCFDREGRYESTYCAGSPGVTPDTLVFGPDGALYFTDAFNSKQVYRVQRSAAHVFIANRYAPDAPGRHFGVPRGMCFDDRGRLLVADRESGDVLAFAGPEAAKPGRLLELVVDGLSRPQSLLWRDDKLYATQTGGPGSGLWSVYPTPAARAHPPVALNFVVEAQRLDDGSTLVVDTSARLVFRVLADGEIIRFGADEKLIGPTHVLLMPTENPLTEKE
ncbi:hypothetical protein HED60_06440 [Planctomycetales bacterium ZRK34]|nr:hypothetical protein HED60_06440 [Planctomycetales bacterium ZRK34]